MSTSICQHSHVAQVTAPPYTHSWILTMLQELQTLSWKYLRMYPLKDITWKGIQAQLTSLKYDESMDFQKRLLTSTVQHPTAQKYPVTLAYTRLFLKALIHQIEVSNHEVCEELYMTYTKMLSQDTSTQCSKYCFRTYNLEDNGVITLKETCKLICDGTTGLCTWEASRVLADWCRKESAHFKDKNILELGAGLGLLGLTVLRRCKPLSYTFTDIHPTVLKTLSENIQLNLAGRGFDSMQYDNDKTSTVNDWANDVTIKYNDIDVQIKKLDWASDSCDCDVDVILAADVVYDSDIIRDLVNILKDTLSKNPASAAYVASTIRNPDTYAFFKDTLASVGLAACSESYHQYQESPSQPKCSITILHISLLERPNL
ncbi:LOW QUALITY PROTEIN: protein-lysine N-methyltransferase EEF2KMT [Procambarus clarkii]|uniref:LOW QUALITY PROTEIN: protein-lysine N-methyltransferase EEF2KMT n=1 Tax=Procambarus clarkii TaxID=6728 RepID=UPI0037444DA2